MKHVNQKQFKWGKGEIILGITEKAQEARPGLSQVFMRKVIGISSCLVSCQIVKSSKPYDIIVV